MIRIGEMVIVLKSPDAGFQAGDGCLNHASASTVGRYSPAFHVVDAISNLLGRRCDLLVPSSCSCLQISNPVRRIKCLRPDPRKFEQQ